jgi:hypothetical protein
MELSLPLQKLEITKIRLGSLSSRPNREKKPMIPLAYMDGQLVMPILTILLPHMTVDSYNSANGRLDLIIDSAWIGAKLNSIQSSLLTALSQSQNSWFGKVEFTNQDICTLFQPMIEGNKLHLYCPSTLVEKRKGSGVIKLWKDDSWIEGVRPGLLAPGQRIRVALQLQGISLQLGTTDNEWTGRSRLQHRVLCIYIQSPKTSSEGSTSSPPSAQPPSSGNS